MHIKIDPEFSIQSPIVRGCSYSFICEVICAKYNMLWFYSSGC